MPVGHQNIDDVFMYHAPTSEQVPHYEAIREGARVFAYILAEHTPQCADQQAMFRLLRECVMTANAAVALHGQI
jgi:hypothetical protein